MIVEVIAVHVMQPSGVDKVDMGAMLHGHVLLTGMAVRVLVSRHPRDQFLGLGIGGGNFKGMLVDMAAIHVVQVPVMEEIDMPVMIQRLMAAGLAVGMGIMPGMQNIVRLNRSSKNGKCKCGD